MPIVEAKTPISKRGIWFLLFMVFVVPLALFGLYVVATLIYLFFIDGLDGWGV